MRRARNSLYNLKNIIKRNKIKNLIILALFIYFLFILTLSEEEYEYERKFETNEHFPNEFERCVMKKLDFKTIGELYPINKKRGRDINTIETKLIEYYTFFKKYTRDFKECKPKTLVFKCREGCQGFGGRVRQLIISFYWALSSGMDLEFLLDNPINIKEYFTATKPFTYELSQKENDKNFTSTMLGYPDTEEEYKTKEFVESYYANDVVFANPGVDNWQYFFENPYFENRINAMFPYLKKKSKYELAKIVLDLFFIPSPFLNKEYERYRDKYFSEKNAFKIGIQMRMGDVVFNENSDSRHTWEAPEIFADKAIETCNLKSYRKCVFFITSDSSKAIEIIRKKILSETKDSIIFSTDGDPHHISIDVKGDAKTLHLKTFLDWYILSEMDFLIFGRSVYGETSSWRLGIDSLRWDRSTKKFIDYIDFFKKTGGELPYQY